MVVRGVPRALGVGRVCEEDIGPVNVSILGGLLEDACVREWTAQAEWHTCDKGLILRTRSRQWTTTFPLTGSLPQGPFFNSLRWLSTESTPPFTWNHSPSLAPTTPATNRSHAMLAMSSTYWCAKTRHAQSTLRRAMATFASCHYRVAISGASLWGRVRRETGGGQPSQAGTKLAKGRARRANIAKCPLSRGGEASEPLSPRLFTSCFTPRSDSLHQLPL